MTEPWLQAEIDQAETSVRDVRRDGESAAAGLRCTWPPVGCGRPLPGPLSTAFRDRRSRAEYDITHLCQSCQDQMWAVSDIEVMEMALDTENFGRCGCCGEYRPYEFVDVGVGVIRGFDCCRDDQYAASPRCAKTAGCWLGADHFHGCESSP